MDELYHEVEQALGHRAFTIYGGALRDTVLGYPINDIDVATNYGPELGTGFTPLRDDSLPDYEGTNLAEVWTNGRINVAVFFGPIDPETVANYCDIGLCQIAMDQNLVHYTPHFTRDVENRTLTRIEPRPNLNHFEKLMTRFAERGFKEGDHCA